MIEATKKEHLRNHRGRAEDGFLNGWKVHLRILHTHTLARKSRSAAGRNFLPNGEEFVGYLVALVVTHENAIGSCLRRITPSDHIDKQPSLGEGDRTLRSSVPPKLPR